jgi:hypothetical protein
MQKSPKPAVSAAQKLIPTAALVAFLLAGCGKSADAKREDIVRCSGFSLALINLRPGSPLERSTEAALEKAGITAGDTMPLGAAAQKYANAMDPAKVTRLAQEGSAAATGFIQKNDANGIADYLKGCVAAYKDLGS